jgi:hypothetical protein
VGNYKEVIVELEEECEGRGAIFSPTGNTCSLLKQKCYAVWKDMFLRHDVTPFKRIIVTKTPKKIDELQVEI